MNQHRWEKWIENEEDKAMLLAAKARLKEVWEEEAKDTEYYPINTSSLLGEIRTVLLKMPASKKTRRRYLNLRKPRKLTDLVAEGLIASIWEERNSGKFRDALRRAAAIDFDNVRQCWKVFQTIISAMESAYLVDFLGWEFLPKPKVNILHTGLHAVAVAAGLKDQNRQGFAEFLDDLCPCGLKQHEGAVRQLLRRSSRTRLPSK